MGRPRRPERPSGQPGPFGAHRYGLWIGAAAVVVAALLTLGTLLAGPSGSAGVAPGRKLPPFAVPLASGNLTGDADVATRPDQGAAGRRPACAERGAGILNICELYEQGPVVLALFIDEGGCEAVLDELQRLAPEFPGVRFAAVEIKGERAPLRALERTHRLRSVPIGIDRDGALAALYNMVGCPQLTFAYRGGAAQGKALFAPPPLAALRARLEELVAGARARSLHAAGSGARQRGSVRRRTLRGHPSLHPSSPRGRAKRGLRPPALTG
jgi:hypothetical protein